MFNVATNALKHTDVRKVVIMERIPRFDSVNDDPHSIKPKLSELANHHLHQLLLNSNYNGRIVIGRHNLESSERRNEIYGNGKFCDGIHLRGPSGQHSYTQSVINILKNAGLQRIGNRSSLPAMAGSKSSSSGPDSAPRTRSRKEIPRDHFNCEQAVFQRSQKKTGSVSTSASSSRNIQTQHQHTPVFFNRGNINDFFYSQNIFDTFNNMNNSGN